MQTDVFDGTEVEPEDQRHPNRTSSVVAHQSTDEIRPFFQHRYKSRKGSGMRNVFLGAAIVLSAAALNSQYVLAALLDDAKAAVAQKQYDKVDTFLAAELAQKVPSPDALRISMDAALASGRIVTAGSRVTALLKLSGEKDPELLFRGGQIAQLNGDIHNALIRFLAYARQASTKTDQADEAFRYILRGDAYPDQYKQYVKLFGADARSWSLGLMQFQKLVDALNGDQALELAGFLMTTFPDPENVDAIDSASTPPPTQIFSDGKRITTLSRCASWRWESRATSARWIQYSSNRQGPSMKKRAPVSCSI